MDVGDVSIAAQASPRRSVRFGALAVVALAAFSGGCGDSPPDGTEPLEGADLVAGTSLFRHGLLAVPRGGGLAELRAIEDPLRVRWRGERELPASVEAHAIGRSVVLRTEGGEISLYEPATETLRTLDTVSAAARWIASGDGGAFVAPERALVIRAGASRVVTTDGRFVWVAPASSDRVVALVETGSGHRLDVWEEPETPATSAPVDSPGPVVLTGAGGEVLLPEGDDGRLVERSLPDLAATERLTLDRRPSLLATSPSEHRLFAAMGGDARLITIDRYAWERLERSRTEGSVRDIRPSVTGDLLLYADETGVWTLDPEESSRTEIESEWRGDLPVALPGGRVLGIRAGETRLFEADGEPGDVVPDVADAWWLPIRWRPRAIEVLVRAADTVARDSAAGEVGERPAVFQEVGLTTMGQVSGRAVAAAPPERPGATWEDASREGDTDAGERVPNGFYAVATSSRQLPSLRDLQRSLESAGYPTQVLPRVDEANETWYRLLVGPYDSRDRAEAAATQLRRERGISAWIQEVLSGVAAPGGR